MMVTNLLSNHAKQERKKRWKDARVENRNFRASLYHMYSIIRKKMMGIVKSVRLVESSIWRCLEDIFRPILL
jgi:hypothetical protein